MEKLSIEEKARRYDEALEIAKNINNEHRAQPFNVMTRVFQELKEPEDDRYKRILHSITNKISLHLCDIFTEEEYQCFDAWSNAWLEKQGEQKPTLRERYKNIAESEWFKKTHDGMSVSNDEGMIEALRTEYEKGRADVIADTLSWLENCWPRYCSNHTIIEGFKEAIK